MIDSMTIVDQIEEKDESVMSTSASTKNITSSLDSMDYDTDLGTDNPNGQIRAIVR